MNAAEKKWLKDEIFKKSLLLQVDHNSSEDGVIVYFKYIGPKLIHNMEEFLEWRLEDLCMQRRV